MVADDASPPVDGWGPAAVSVSSSAATDLQASLVLDAAFAVVGGLAIYWGIGLASTSSRVFLIVFGSLFVLPLLNLGRRRALGSRGRIRTYRFGPGWASLRVGERDGPVSETVVRTDSLRSVRVTANTFGRRFVDLTDTDGRRLRLVADELKRGECWRLVASGIRASVESGALEPSARLKRMETWISFRGSP